MWLNIAIMKNTIFQNSNKEFKKNCEKKCDLSIAIWIP